MPIKLPECLACGGDSLTQLLDWGLMPLANNYNIKEKYPLRLNRCDRCFHLQLDEMVEPEILFKDYPYFSGTSKTSLDYFKEMAEIALRYSPSAKNVLDIACNDGSQLDAFKQLGFDTHGVDPAENLYPVSSLKGHSITCGMFPVCLVELSSYDVVVAQNVVAHTPDPLSFLQGCKKIMHDESFLFIATSQANMISGVEYDTIYHEHCSYFNTQSMKRLLERAGLFLEDVFTHPIHGTSYVFVAKKKPTRNPVEVRIDKEDQCGLYSSDTYTKWVEECKEKAAHTKKEIERYREEYKMKVIGCGAAAKGITFLNMSKTEVDFIVDTTPAKWYSDAAGVKIFPFEYLKTVNDDAVLFVILAWNFYDEIVANIRKYRNNPCDIFITTNHS